MNNNNNMQSGFVSKFTEGFFLILHYGATTRVYARVIDAETVRDACSELGRLFSGTFTPADADQIAWSRALLNRGGGVPVLMS